MGLTSIGSNPMFPIINKVLWIAYFLNHYRLALASRQFFFFLRKNKKTISYLKLFKTLGIILNFFFFNNRLKCFLKFFNHITIYKNFKLISKLNHFFYIKHEQLKIIAKYTGNSIYILSTPLNLISHKIALEKKIGGKVIFLFY